MQQQLGQRLSAHTVAVIGTAYGCRFSLELPEDLCELAELGLPSGWEPIHGPAGVPGPTSGPALDWQLAGEPAGWRPLRSGRPLGGPQPAEVALELVLADLELWVAEHAAELVFVRAGAVVWRDRAVLLPGRAQTGKTTMVAALVRAGASYLSDAFAVVRPDGLVEPYPRRLSLRPPGGTVVRRTPISALGGVTQLDPAPIGLVAQLGYDADAEWAVTELSPGGACLAVVSSAPAAPHRPAEVTAIVQSALDDAAAITGTRGESRDAARQLLHGPWTRWY